MHQLSEVLMVIRTTHTAANIQHFKSRIWKTLEGLRWLISMVSILLALLLWHSHLEYMTIGLGRRTCN